MALGTRFDFDIHRGDDRQIPATVVTPAGVAVDISAASFIWILARQDLRVEDPVPAPRGAAIITKTVGSGIVITDGPNGGVRVDLGSGDTVALTAPREYYHELQMTISGDVTTILFGVLKLKRDIAVPGP